MASKSVLMEAMQRFDGTLIFVSHDRYFIEGVAEKVLELDHGKARLFPGDYEYYLWRKEKKAVGDQNCPGNSKPETPLDTHSEHLEKKRIKAALKKLEKGLLAGVLAVSIDVGIDAIFVAYGIWRWSEGQWFGVPLANYTAWFMAVGGFVAVWSDIDALKAHLPVKELGMAAGIVIAYGLLLVMVLATYLMTEAWFAW